MGTGVLNTLNIALP